MQERELGRENPDHTHLLFWPWNARILINVNENVKRRQKTVPYFEYIVEFTL